MTPQFDNFIQNVLKEAIQHISKECEETVERILNHPLVKSTFKMDGQTWDRNGQHPKLRTGERFTFYAKYPDMLPDRRYSMFTTHYTSSAVKPMLHWLQMLERSAVMAKQNDMPNLPYGKGKTFF